MGVRLKPAGNLAFKRGGRGVVPVLRARGYELLIESSGDTWYVTWVTPDGAPFTGFNVSLPAAFCEAALKALGASDG